MVKGFDNEKYLKMQSEHIKERIAQFGNKLYLEFGGKLFDDYHASRVLPGFEPDSKLQMLLQLKDHAEVVIVISAEDIEENKIRGDYGITYDMDVLRLIDEFQSVGLYVGSVCLTKFTGQPAAESFQNRLQELGIKSYRHYKIPGYPNDVDYIVSDNGYGKNDYIETERPLVVITAPGPGSGKMATCLSQLYHEHKRGINAGYAKFETFPIWNIPLKHPVNLAYEAATADLNDVNMIDPYHLEAYGETTVNYNRDIEIFPVVNAIFQLISGESPYKSPTDMGVNMAGNCIIDDEVCCKASKQEIIRRYYQALCEKRRAGETKKNISKLENLMQQAQITVEDRKVIVEALKKVKVRNPLMLLDEIDKTGKDQRGDTASALLEVLDPEQNEHFTDHYLEVALNLSDVLFVATANDLSTIPRPLLDRMEIIEVSSYTENEKYHIANDYLVKKQMEANGLNDTQIHWKEDALRFLITDYTREAGVRNLERRIGQVSRKVTRDIYQKKHRKVTITKKVIKEYLGRPVYEWEKDTLRDQIGIVHGLAWTAVGGVTLKIEVNVMPGKGAVQVTGSLGNVMKESAQAAISYIRSQSRKYKIKQDFFEKHDIHIHIPEGAVPKDGPSAGITMTTAVLSAVTGNKVCGNLAMTGEVTIRGDVLMIGGLKEKLLAAKRLGITKVLVPKSNEKDVKEFEEEVVEGLEIVYVKTMTQVIKEAFVH